MASENHTQKIKKEYEEHLMKHDFDSPEAVHWVGRDKTWLRFEILTQVDHLDHKKVLDFGCGNALLLDFLLEKGIGCEYNGWDISERMIEVAKRRHPGANFRTVNVLKDNLIEFYSFFDYILVSGLFNLKANTEEDIHRKWTGKILLKLWALCKEGLALNFMTEHVDWRDSSLYYCPINEIVSFSVNNLSRWLTIRHDYELWEFTIYIYKKPRAKP